MRQKDIDEAAAHFSRAPDMRLDLDAAQRSIWRRYQQLLRTHRVRYTDEDPYTDTDAMRAEYRTGTLFVFAGHNEVLPREIHLALRAVHDADHCESGADFTMGGEWRAVRVAASRDPQLACFWASEILGQNCTYFATGLFPAHRLVAGMDRWLDDHSLPHSCPGRR